MSYETLTHVNDKAEVKAHEEKWGRFNDAPPGFTEITAEEFATSGFFTWCKTAQEFRQISPENIDQSKMLAPVKYFLGITLFYMNHGENYGLARYEDRVRYFKFADCYHDWVEISAKEAGKPAWNCYHYNKCSKCGARWEYDSSG